MWAASRSTAGWRPREQRSTSLKLKTERSDTARAAMRAALGRRCPDR
jgi:hypothetical protein